MVSCSNNIECEMMTEVPIVLDMNTSSTIKCSVVCEQKISSLRNIARLNWTPSSSNSHLFCHGFSTKAQIIGGLAFRNYKILWGPWTINRRGLRDSVERTGRHYISRWTSARKTGNLPVDWGGLRNSVERTGIHYISSCTSARKAGNLPVDWRDEGTFNWNYKARKIIEDVYIEKSLESLEISGSSSDETSFSSERDCEEAPKYVNEGDRDLHREDRDIDRLIAEVDENRIDQIDSSVQLEHNGDLENKSEGGQWWEDEVVEEESTLSSTSVRGTGEVGKDGGDRFRIRNGREVYVERTYLVGIDCKGAGKRSFFSIKDSLQELAQLADTAGLVVVGSTYQKLDSTNPKTYIGIGKVAEIQAAIRAFKVETIIFDDELSPGQLRNLEKAFAGDVRVCDRTALILDIFKQRAATREATLQVELAQFEYQLPRLTRMWTHLERQAGGMVKGMGEKQIEIDKRILRTRISALKQQLESVRDHRQQYRDRRAAVPIPVVSLVGYTNAGKSTFLNRLSGANVVAEDRLFATLDPTTRRVQLPNGKECLFTDTVGFIQKLPTQLVAAFRATLEEITDSSLLVHMVDISHPMAEQQVKAVNNVLSELDVLHISVLTVWNKIDKAENPGLLRAEAASRENVICVSALTGEGIDGFSDAVEKNLKDLMVWVQAVVPYDQGDLISIIHRLGIVEKEEFTEHGTLIMAHVPLALSRKLFHLRQALT